MEMPSTQPSLELFSIARNLFGAIATPATKRCERHRAWSESAVPTPESSETSRVSLGASGFHLSFPFVLTALAAVYPVIRSECGNFSQGPADLHAISFELRERPTFRMVAFLPLFAKGFLAGRKIF